jgi:metallo-beta-lactamase class B
MWGNTWYVGTCGITAILITGNDGHILIDTGPANAAKLVAANIETLGFKLTDVKLLLHSHEHHDHIGGLAELQRLTGARLLASPAAARALTSGTAVADDPQFGEHSTFPGARVDGEVRDGDIVRLGNLALHAIATPGHTPGAMSWYWNAPLGDDVDVTVTYADSLTPVSSEGYRFSDHPEYLQAYRHSLARIAALNCRILFTPHPSASGMRERILGRGVTRTACRGYAEALEVRLKERLASETDAG